MEVVLSLEFDQVQRIVDQLKPEEQRRLAEYLGKKAQGERLASFRDEKRGVALSLDEIQSEVKAARRERYDREHRS